MEWTRGACRDTKGWDPQGRAARAACTALPDLVTVAARKGGRQVERGESPHAVKAHLGAFETCADSTRIPQSRWTMAVLLPCCLGAVRLEPTVVLEPTGGRLLTTGPAPSDNECGARNRVGRRVIREGA